MSSHHIVRDEQEPAIIITYLKPNFWKAIDQLLGWSPTVIVTSECVEKVLLKGIKIDLVVGSASQLKQRESLLVDQQPIETLECDVAKILSTAIEYLLNKNYKAVNIFSELKLNMTSDQTINCIWYNDELRYVKSSNYSFRKWLPEQTNLCILPTTDNQEFKSDGLTKVENLEYMSNNSGMVTLASDHNFWIGQAY